MKLYTIISSLFLFMASAMAAEKPNVLLICIDDLNTQLPAFGHKHVRTPNIDKLASQGRLFKRHYVQAPTCGVSRFSLLSGLYPPAKAGNGLANSYFNGKNPEPSLPHTLKANGYTTVSIGKVSHHPGGNTGKDWNDPDKEEIPGAWTRHLMPCGPWKTPRAAMHGYKGGKARIKGQNPVYETTNEYPAYPDDLIAEKAITELGELSKAGNPWFLAVGFIKPHLPFTAPQRFVDMYENVDFPPTPSPEKPTGRSLWHRSTEFHQYLNSRLVKDPAQALAVRKHYAASTSYVDDSVGKVLKALQKSGVSDNTIVILWSDHGFSLGEKAIWGKHHLYQTAIHSPLVVRLPEQKQPGKTTEAIAESIDIYPTLCELTGITLPKHLEGKSLVDIVNDPLVKSDGTANSFWNGDQSIVTHNTHTIRRKGKPYLKFDLKNDPHEEKNLIGE